MHGLSGVNNAGLVEAGGWSGMPTQRQRLSGVNNAGLVEAGRTLSSSGPDMGSLSGVNNAGLVEAAHWRER